jgi:hypothetical protein
MSKVFKSLFMMAALTLALVDSPLAADARGMPARAGSATYAAEAGCWAPHGASMTNICSVIKGWYLPLLLDGSWNGWYTVDVVAEAVGNGGYAIARCRLMTTYAGGEFAYMTDWYNVPTNGSPQKITLSAWAPGGGTGMIDCEIGPQSKVHTVNW